MKKLGVIILNWNGLQLLKDFLPVASRYTVCDEVDLIVADNGSTDDSVSWVRSEHPEVRVIEFDKNYGFAEGYNRAIAECKYEFITLLNSDVEVTPDWWKPILAFMVKHNDVGATQPKILSWHDRNKFEYAGACGGFLDKLGYPFCRGRLFDSIETDNGQYDNCDPDITWASGACLTVRRELYLRVGGLDSKFFAHMEEIDLCCRMISEGFRICVVTASKVYHVGGASLNQGNPQKTYLNFRNNLLLLHKNLPRKRGRKILFFRRMADTLAFGMFLLKGDLKNARAIVKAHNDFRKMRKEYPTSDEKDDFLSSLTGGDKSAVWQHYVLGRKIMRL
ncbi:MAG: glycosyltransferase family 2 protein [Muribaculaceae bacterium]|nr:glycosyltransferase family 2 protein [Muribaculaceae bacterium]